MWSDPSLWHTQQVPFFRLPWSFLQFFATCPWRLDARPSEWEWTILQLLARVRVLFLNSSTKFNHNRLKIVHAEGIVKLCRFHCVLYKYYATVSHEHRYSCPTKVKIPQHASVLFGILLPVIRLMQWLYTQRAEKRDAIVCGGSEGECLRCWSML